VRWELSRRAGVIGLAAVDHLGAAGAASVGLEPSLKAGRLKVGRLKVGRKAIVRSASRRWLAMGAAIAAFG